MKEQARHPRILKGRSTGPCTLPQSDSSRLHPGSTHIHVEEAVSTPVTVIASSCNSSAGREYCQAGLNSSVTFSHSSTSPFTIMPARKFSFKPNIHKRRLAGKGFITTGQSRILQQNDEQSLKFLRPLLLHPVAENKDIHVPSSVRLFKTIPMLTDQAQHDQGHLLMRLPAHDQERTTSRDVGPELYSEDPGYEDIAQPSHLMYRGALPEIMRSHPLQTEQDSSPIGSALLARKLHRSLGLPSAPDEESSEVNARDS